jgi:hypothetical protein
MSAVIHETGVPSSSIWGVREQECPLGAAHEVTLVNAAGEVTKGVAVALVNDALESVALPAHVEVTVIHRTSSITVRETRRKR